MPSFFREVVKAGKCIANETVDAACSIVKKPTTALVAFALANLPTANAQSNGANNNGGSGGQFVNAPPVTPVSTQTMIGGGVALVVAVGIVGCYIRSRMRLGDNQADYQQMQQLPQQRV